MTSLPDYKLFTPFQLSESLMLKSRVVYGPATRARADLKTREPTERMSVYYEERASAGLLIAELCAISEQGYGWWGTPAMYNDEQQAVWTRLVERVHKKDGRIFLQLWHTGRQSHPSFNDKREVVSASATRLENGTTRDANGDRVGFEAARALELNEIADIVEDCRKCAERAKAAGFDGVEIHGANGYLVDQFLQSCTNKRTDHYGGSFENRYRFLHEIIETVKTVYPADRIGVRVAPNGVNGGMGSHDNFNLFTYVFEQLSVHGLAYLALLDGEFVGVTNKSTAMTVFDAKKAFGGTVIANNSLTRDTAEGVLRSGAADLVGFVRLFLSNPDLVERFQNDWPLNGPVPHEHYWDAHMGDVGYNVYTPYNKQGSF